MRPVRSWAKTFLSNVGLFTSGDVPSRNMNQRYLPCFLFLSVQNRKEKKIEVTYGDVQWVALRILLGASLPCIVSLINQTRQNNIRFINE